jgi:hypothetical protein
MNKTQKEAVANLIVWSLCLAFGFFILVEIVFFKAIYYRFHLFYCLLMVAAIALGLLFIFRKQSPREVDSDERDRLIKLRAALVSFVSVWILLAAVTFICRFAVGIEGVVSVWALSIINFVVFLAAMMIYWIAILVQYWNGDAHGEKRSKKSDSPAAI